APVDLVEGHLLGGVAATVRHVSGVLVGVVPGGPGAAGSHGRGEHRRETRAQQSPRHLPSGSPGARPAALSRRGVARSLTATAAPDDHVVLLPRVVASVAVTVRRPPRSPPRGPSVWGAVRVGAIRAGSRPCGEPHRGVIPGGAHRCSVPGVPCSVLSARRPVPRPGPGPSGRSGPGFRPPAASPAAGPRWPRPAG